MPLATRTALTSDERQKLGLLVRRIREGAADPYVVDLAHRSVARVRHDRERVARTLHRYVRDGVQYIDEVPERFQGAAYTLSRGQGDCDCQVIALASMALAAGVPVDVVHWDRRGIMRHVCARLYVGGTPRWAETTVRAAFNEHPLAAARRTAPQRRDMVGA